MAKRINGLDKLAVLAYVRIIWNNRTLCFSGRYLS